MVPLHAMKAKPSLFPSLFRALLPPGPGTAREKERNRFQGLGWILQKLILKNRKLRLGLLCQVSTREAHLLRREGWQSLLERKQKITVVFEVTTISKWKADSLLRLMLVHPRLTPIVWHIPPQRKGKNEARHMQERQQCRDYFAAAGVKFVTYDSLGDFPMDETPDLVFPNEPYNAILLNKCHSGLLKRFLCFIPYGYTCSFSEKSRNLIITNAALEFYVENEDSREQCKKLMDNRAVNVAATGHPMADSFLFPEGERPQAWKECGEHMKKVIWAPHWSITKDTVWLFYGTFLHTAEILLEMAEKYRGQIQFAFKPHPNLYDTLCRHPQWGKEKTDAFYARWREMPNTQFENGAYVDLFMQSDAMIHDCGSFIQEYLFADKPCMYLKYPDNHPEYSAMAADCLNAYQMGITREEIEAFLQVVLRGEDPKAEIRRELRKKYLIPPNGKSAAQNIIDRLLSATCREEE